MPERGQVLVTNTTPLISLAAATGSLEVGAEHRREHHRGVARIREVVGGPAQPSTSRLRTPGLSAFRENKAMVVSEGYRLLIVVGRQSASPSGHSPLSAGDGLIKQHSLRHSS
jgi:hypothetical protein